MDAAGLTKLLSPEGWALLAALPPYDEGRTIALSERLRREGADPDLVAAALTQSRLRAKAHAKLDTFADAMLFVCAVFNLLACYMLLPKVREEMRSFLRGIRSGEIEEVPVEERATT